jgi:hypothetical protein
LVDGHVQDICDSLSPILDFQSLPIVGQRDLE